MIVKMTILRLLGSSDDKEKIGVARPEGPKDSKIEETVKKPLDGQASKEEKNTFLLLGCSLGLLLQLGGLIFQSRNCPAPKLRPGPPEA